MVLCFSFFVVFSLSMCNCELCAELSETVKEWVFLMFQENLYYIYIQNSISTFFLSIISHWNE